MKRILGLLLLSSSMFAMELAIVHPEQKAVFVKSMNTKMHKMHIDSSKVQIDSKSMFVPARLGEIELFHSEKGFCVYKDEVKHPVQKFNIDKEIRHVTKDELQSVLAKSYVCLNQMDNGEYSLKASPRLSGGGALGASIGAFLGKAAVYVLGHGAIQVVAVCTGPLYPVTVMALEGVFAVPIEAASMAGAVAGGIALGVATGPI